MNHAQLARQQHAIDGDWLHRSLNFKGCAACGHELPLEAFAKSSRNAGRVGKGRATNCRACESDRQRAMRQARAARG
jgi:hypothetical protein